MALIEEYTKLNGVFVETDFSFNSRSIYDFQIKHAVGNCTTIRSKNSRA